FRSIVPPNTGGMPGMPRVSFCCAIPVAGTSASPSTAHAKPAPSIRAKRLLVMISSFVGSPRHFEFRPPRVVHQRAPYPLPQRHETRHGERRALARPRQIDLDDFVYAAGAALEHHHAIAHEHRLVDRMRDEHHGGGTHVPDAQ